MTISLGVGLVTCQHYPGDPRSDRQLYAEALAFAEAAEDAGLDSVFVSEHHFVDDGYLPSPLALCAAIAARTERIRIGTALLLAPLHDPLRVAEDAAVVDLISGGRLVLGLGLGWRQEEFDGFGVPLSARVRRLEQTVAVARQAWGDGLVVGTPSSPYPELAVHPKPCHRDGVPIWIGAMSEPAARRAGRIGDGFMATEVTPDQLRTQVGWAGEGLAERESPPAHEFIVSLHLPVFAWDDGDAFELVRDQLHYVGWKYEDMEHARSSRTPLGPPAVDEAAAAALRSSVLAGPAAEVAGRIDEYRRAAGGTLHFIARLYLPGLPADLQLHALRHFAEHVAPQVRKMAGDVGP
jgi:alkanesulfonate monooxygenase SsuD/methylene tetrahydromethanopterin reductase-like flavin-dependent oxidoreductase (luciferase family)